MTLICTHLEGSSSFLAVSDILLTAKGDALYPMALPLRAGPVFHTSRGSSLAGAALKSVIFGRTLVSWAGPKRIADRVLNFILAASENGEREIVYLDVSRNSGVPRNEALQIQLIYHFIKPNGDITLWAWQCQEKQLGNTRAIFGGSGGPAYADATDVQAPDAERAKDDVTAILARAIGQLVTEAQTDDTLDQHYGGWIELCVYRGDRFDKEKYALKLWYLRNGRSEYAPGPLLFNFYRGHALVVAKLSYETTGDQKARELFEIGDPLGRDSLKPDEGPNVHYDPMTLIHMVIDTEDNHVETFMTAGDNMGFEVVIDKDFNVEQTIEPRFWDIITGKTPSPGMWIVD